MFWKAANGAGGVERLTTSLVPQFPEAFSPDGTQLVFRQEKQGDSDLYLLSMEGEYNSQPLLATTRPKTRAITTSFMRCYGYSANFRLSDTESVDDWLAAVICAIIGSA